MLDGDFSAEKRDEQSLKAYKCHVCARAVYKTTLYFGAYKNPQFFHALHEA